MDSLTGPIAPRRKLHRREFAGSSHAVRLGKTGGRQGFLATRWRGRFTRSNFIEHWDARKTSALLLVRPDPLAISSLLVAWAFRIHSEKFAYFPDFRKLGDLVGKPGPCTLVIAILTMPC